jgi:histidinol-phosphate/aromatic aminotransferase/cobyric acid decarboxylase-like protein
MYICRRDLLRAGLLHALGETSLLPVKSAAGATSPAKPIRLNRNESPYGPCEKANEAMREAIDLCLGRPSSTSGLRTASIAFRSSDKAL